MQVLRQEDSDTIRAAFHIDAITSDAIPILSALEREVETQNIILPINWIHKSAHLLGNLVNALRIHAQIGETR